MYRRGAYVFAVLLVGVCIGWVAGMYGPWAHQDVVENRGAVLRQSSTDYTYISPLLACDIGTEESFPELAPIKASVEQVIAAATQDGSVSDVSVYVRALKSARWFEIDGQTTYAPASLLKVFIMMAYYKEDDDRGNGSVLGRSIVFEGSANPQQDMPGEVIPHLVAGQHYTVAQVIDQMIIYSDNDAMTTLVDNFDSQTLQEFKNIFSDLDIPSPLTQTEDAMNFMPVDSYAMVFRILFSATYLSRQYSNEALALLARAHYADGIVAGVPSGTMVAHKFGVRSIPASQNGGVAGAELHDCGIVYYPKHPYLLCVMTRGTSVAALEQTLQQVSKTTYQGLSTFFATAASSTPSTIGPVARPR